MYKILVIDDEENIRKAVKIALRSNKEYSVIVARDGTGGLSIARSELPDLILLDVTMPDINGFEVLRELKEETSTSLIPVIMVTGKTDDAAIKQAIYEYDAAYIAKPFESDVLRSTVAHVLSAKN